MAGQGVDDDLPPSEGDAGDKNQDEEKEDEGLFDVYSNRSSTAEGHTTKGMPTLGGGFPNHSSNCRRRHDTNNVKSAYKLRSCGVLVFERSGMYSLAVLSSSKWYE